MATTENQLIQSRGAAGLQGVPVKGSTRLPQGTLAFLDAGYATGTAGSNQFIGLNKNLADNSSGADGSADTEVYTEGVFFLEGSGFSQATVGSDIYASDNFTVTTTSTSNAKIGRCVEYVSATKIGVKIDVQQS